VRLDRPAVIEGEMALPPNAVRALSFWDHRPGSILTVVDQRDTVFRARFLGGDRVVPFQILSSPQAPVVPLVLYQALPEKERFELVLEKVVELGVDRIVPFVSSRSATLEERDSKQRKSHRWPDIVRRAAKQCRRPDIPELGPVMSFAEVLDEIACWDLSVMFYEAETTLRLRDSLRRPGISSVALIVGPEGGFSPAEALQAATSRVQPVTLGQRILRTETAAMAGVTLLQYALGTLG
jgi:16S rRNA (uracil1498-N3)-methyltransferase